MLHRAGCSCGVGKEVARNMACPRTPDVGAVLDTAKGEAKMGSMRAALAPQTDTCWLKKLENELIKMALPA